MAEIVSLAEAVERAIHDGDAVAMEGFTHLIPFAAGHEVIRQRRRDLTLIRMTPDLIYDQLIGAGCARKLIFSWGGNPGVGSLHRFRDAVENAWPVPLEIEEHSHAGMANRYVAGASGLPFAVLRGYNGTGLETLNGGAGSAPTIKPITCPFTGETLTAVSALRPDVAVIHAQRADRTGNVQLWGITGVQREAVLASARSVVTVEEIVDELDPRPGAVVLPGWTVTFVARAPGGAHPSYALGYSVRDNDYYVAWDVIARDRDTFTRWLCSLGGDDPPRPPPIMGGLPAPPYLPGPPGPPSRGDMTYTADEMMTVSAARALRDGMTCFVGIGLPSSAANLARATHAPSLVLIYESGTIGAKPDRLPLSIGDGMLAETADAVVSVPEIFNYWLQPGRIDVGFLGAAQIDKFGNINTTVIGGDYGNPKVRLPGAGGAPEIAASCREVIVVVRQNHRSFVERVDFVTSVGYGSGRTDRERLGLTGAGPKKIITDLGVLEPDPETLEFTLTGLYPGVSASAAKERTGWDLAIAADPEIIAAPTPAELDALRRFQGTRARSHQ